jgi:hypothetical protein
MHSGMQPDGSGLITEIFLVAVSVEVVIFIMLYWL